MYITGVRIEHGLFSRDMVGVIVSDYSFNASRLSDRRWNIITALCGDNRETTSVEMHELEHVDRRALYEPSSPMKASDDE